MLGLIVAVLLGWKFPRTMGVLLLLDFAWSVLAGATTTAHAVGLMVAPALIAFGVARSVARGRRRRVPVGY